ncbi:MAG: hypothetical protein ACREVP_03365 [Burkholderiales bacterium]
MAHVKVWLACAALAAASGAHAQAQAQGQGTVWKCVEADGRAHYTNIKRETDGKQCTVVTKEVSVVSPPSRPAAAEKAGSGFPKVDRETQRTRDESRRRILEDELTAEEKGLIDAKAQLAAQEAVRYGDEKNYQRVLDRLKPYQDAVERHARNISALRKELAGLR